MEAFALDAFSYSFSQKLFIQLLAFSYLCAFWSLFKQVVGLYGVEGIVPAQETLDIYKARFGKKAYLWKPTIFWLNSNDQALKLSCVMGIGISLLVLLGVMPAFLLFLLWILYFSFMSIDLVFLSFQWDALLLETGFLGFFFAIQSPPPMMLLIGLWVLLFRLMLSSGLVKILSGSLEWRYLTAMEYHYETQPIPNRIAYYAHQQPKWFLKLSTMGTFFFELILPFFIFGPEKIQLVVCLLLIFFQLLIMFTGNFAFFNILTIALCVPLLQNSSLEWLYGQPLPILVEPNFYMKIILEGIGWVFILLNGLQLAHLLMPLKWIRQILYYFNLYHVINSYGLFAVMTTKRNELILEGSEDGYEWKTYEFKWKPGDLYTPPRQVAPYQPRLDWQMWFAALSTYRENPWLINFITCLLQGSKDVLGLIKTNPFPHPPRFIRIHLYQYHFSPFALRGKTGQWWTREFKGLYMPVVSKKGENVD
jgi:hypothetical protein